ncbi:FkbM family methyltransferase [uncultured Ruegeria sp.]|uniref:FkbM family methyltransferase n=1 Tax=uncultured Ruegeria sp. TaxID=259304 RepID=UPI00261D850F|nr:FkbM family methyltransferase [uncultured Ruegeria sp.]
MRDITREAPEQLSLSVQTRYGPFFIPNGNDLISESLRKYGEWAQSELNILCDFLRDGDTVVDGGACLGTHSRAFSHAVGSNGQVISFEPTTKNRQFLQLNANASLVANIDVRAAALGAQPGTGQVSQALEDNAGGTRIAACETGGTVTVVRLDDEVLGQVSFIKLDLEGSELEALQGANRILSQDRPVVFCEVLDLSGGAQIYKYMSERGYVSYGLITPAFRSDNFNKSEENVFFDSAECGLLFLPEEKFEVFSGPIEKHLLTEIKTLDDLLLLLLQQPQYRQKTLSNQSAAFFLEIPNVHFEARRREQNLKQKIIERDALVTDLEQKVLSNKNKLLALQNKVYSETSELVPLLEQWREENDYTVRLAKRVRKLPFALYFRINAKHRRATRNLQKSDGGPRVALAKLGALRSLLGGSPLSEAEVAIPVGGYRAKVINMIASRSSEAILAPLPELSEPVLNAPAIADRLAGGRNQVVLSISHDNYRKVTGGTQICIQIEAERADQAGMDYLNIHPVRTSNALLSNAETEAAVFRLVLNGESIGVARYSELIAATSDRVSAGQIFQCVIHHLLGHSPEVVAQLLEASCDGKACYWLHDFFAVCQSYNLLRNNLSYCNAPDSASQGCAICKYGNGRAAHMKRFREFFKRIEITALAPSQVAADIWVKACAYELHKLIVQPHTVLKSESRPQPLPTINHSAKAAVKIAFVGAPMLHKGWNEFKALVEAEYLNPDMEFHYFGNTNVNLSIVKHRVDVRASQFPDAMSRALSAAGIDLVIHFAPWPETFSLTTAEALTSSAYVVTHRQSGNVANLVKSTGRGVVLDSGRDLVAWAKSDACKNLVQKTRQRRREEVLSSEYSDMAIPHLKKVSVR